MKQVGVGRDSITNKDFFEVFKPKLDNDIYSFIYTIIAIGCIYLGYYLIKALLQKYRFFNIRTIDRLKLFYKKKISSNPLEQAVLDQNRLIKLGITILAIPFIIKLLYLFINFTIDLINYIPEMIDKFRGFKQYIESAIRLSEKPYYEYQGMLIVVISFFALVTVCYVIKKHLINRI